MAKNFSLFKIEKIKKKISSKSLNSIINLIKFENKDSILAKLSDSLIINYINKASFSKNFFLYLLKDKQNIVGYALFVKDKKYLIEIFRNKKLHIFIYLLMHFKFLTILNLLLAVLNLDLIFLKKKRTKKTILPLNLNLLALKKEYQSRGFGKFFLSKTLEITRNNYRFKILTCEAPNNRVLNFYLKKNNFILIGKKIRLFKNLYVLEKYYQ